MRFLTDLYVFCAASKNDDALSMPTCGSRTRMVLPLIWMLTGSRAKFSSPSSEDESS